MQMEPFAVVSFEPLGTNRGYVFLAGILAVAGEETLPYLRMALTFPGVNTDKYDNYQYQYNLLNDNIFVWFRTFCLLNGFLYEQGATPGGFENEFYVPGDDTFVSSAYKRHGWNNTHDIENFRQAIVLEILKAKIFEIKTVRGNIVITLKKNSDEAGGGAAAATSQLVPDIRLKF